MNSQGSCRLCGQVIASRAIARHLRGCLLKLARAKPQPPGKKTRSVQALHLSVKSQGGVYWMHLAVNSRLALANLDAFLRHVWLECCGHLSAFHLPTLKEDWEFLEDGGDQNMDCRIGEVLFPGIQGTYEYDFGSTTELKIKSLAAVSLPLPRGGIRVLARNDPPQIACGVCGQPVTAVCSCCSFDTQGWLCAKCAKDHPCGEEMLLPVLNSPRTGVCAYTGPDRDDV